METNVIHLGNCVERMQELPEGSVDMCITSPPYFNLRTYKDHEDQIGVEATPQEFVENLCNVFDQVKRVLKPEGVCWVNIGDTYKNKGLLQVPSRFEIEMTNRGWILRNEIIWSKPNPQPTSSKDRFWTNHEKVYMFVKNKKYYFDQPRVPQKEISIKRAFSKNHMDKRKDKGTSDKEGFSLSSENQEAHYVKMRERILAGEIPTRPKFTVWDITQKGYSGAHFAIYPVELLIDPIKSSCPEGGIVLDPFMGSGTTAVASLMHDRQYIGYDINQEYIDIANVRINDFKENGIPKTKPKVEKPVSTDPFGEWR